MRGAHSSPNPRCASSPSLRGRASLQGAARNPPAPRHEPFIGLPMKRMFAPWLFRRCFMRPESETRTPHPISEFPSRLHRYAACPAQQIAVVANIFRMFASFTAARLHSPLEVALRDGPTRSTAAAAVPRVVLDFTWAVNHQRVGAESQVRSVRERR